MLYQLTATLRFDRKRNPVKTLVLATGTERKLCSEASRWKAVAAEWARTAAVGARTKPTLHIDMEPLS